MSDIKIIHTEKVVTKRNEHPNNKKYPARASFEFGTAVRKFMSELNETSKEDVRSFVANEFVYREDITAEFFDSIQVGDVIGVGLFKGLNTYGTNPKKLPSANKFKVLKVDKNNDIITAVDATYDTKDIKEEVELTFEQISCAFGMGFGEILERDGKPFGVSEEIEYTVNVYGQGMADENDNADQTAPVLTDGLETNAKQIKENN